MLDKACPIPRMDGWMVGKNVITHRPNARFQGECTVHCTALVCDENLLVYGNRRDRANARSRSGSIRDFWASKVKDGVR